MIYFYLENFQKVRLVEVKHIVRHKTNFDLKRLISIIQLVVVYVYDESSPMVFAFALRVCSFKKSNLCLETHTNLIKSSIESL